MKCSLEECQDWGQLRGPHPVLSTHEMPVNAEGTEDGTSLRARDLILFLVFLTVFLLSIRIFRQLCQLVGKFVAVDLLYWVEQDDW